MIQLVLLIIFILIPIITILIATIRNFIGSNKNQKKKTIIIVIVLTITIISVNRIGYIPRKPFNIDYQEVTLIKIRDGNTDKNLEIVDRADIKYIIENLNDVTFKKGKSSFFYMGISFDTKIYDSDNNRLKGLIINSANTIRYKGHFHRAYENLIDYDYILNLFKDEYEGYKQ